MAGAWARDSFTRRRVRRFVCGGMGAASCGGGTPAVLGFAGGGQVVVARDELLAFAKACARKTLRSASYPLLRSRPHSQTKCGARALALTG
jgi:hypothetical protein